MAKKSKEKILTKEEFLELELNHAKSLLLSKDKKILDLQRELTSSKRTLLQYMNKDIDNELNELNEKLQYLNKQNDSAKKEREESIDKIKKRLKLKGRFGYNPDTLIVIED